MSNKTFLGKVGMTPKGEWNSLTTYVRLDIVSYEGSSYIALAENTNSTPSVNNINWMLAAKHGEFTEEQLEEFKTAVVAESKEEIDNYTRTKKTELDTYEGTKETELNNYTAIKKSELDTYEGTKETELDNYTGTKKTELDTYVEEILQENKNLLNAGYKLNGTGESVSLNKTSKNRFVKFGIKGNKKQGNNPSPTSPQEIYAVGDNDVIHTNISNKNLLDISNVSSTDYITNNGDGSITLNGNVPSTNFNLTNPMILKAGITYILSLSNLYQGTGLNSTFILRNGTTNIMACKLEVGEITYTPDTDTIIDIIRIYNGGLTFDNYTFIPQLEIGSTKTTQIKHEEQTYTMPCQNPMVGEEDYFDWDNEKEIHGWKKVILTGEETYTVEQSSGYYRFNLTRSNLRYAPGRRTYAISNYFTSSITNEYGNIMTVESRIMFYVSENITTVEQFQAYLAEQYANNTPVYVWYELEEPEELAFTASQKTVANQIKNATSYYEQTNVYSTDNVNPNFDITAIADLNLLIDPIDARLTLVEE